MLEKFKSPQSLIEGLGDEIGATEEEQQLMLTVSSVMFSEDTCLSLDDLVQQFHTIGYNSARLLKEDLLEDSLPIPLFVLIAMQSDTFEIKPGHHPNEGEIEGIYESQIEQAEEQLRETFDDKNIEILKRQLTAARAEDK